MGKAEAIVEKYLTDQIKSLGGIAYKFTSPARRNVPDRLCVLPGRTFFVECKAEDGTLSKGQVKEIARLTFLDQSVLVVSTKAEVDEFIKFLKETWHDRNKKY